MKMRSLAIIAAVFSFTMAAYSESVHQTLPGEAALLNAGKSAVEGKVVEVKTVAGAKNEKLARITGTLSQWGFVSYWFGIPTPAGKSVIRFRIYVEGETAAFTVYLHTSSEQVALDPIKIPSAAKQNTFVTVDIPVDSKNEWSGIAVKKTEKSDKPGPWIESVSVVLP
ncbi:MAG TPA: hypothetical protein DCZ94_16205 [Lentisphaeria bacterium]|nr:MAG: hypothetical protein A2X48_02135 [Lentisphaerae bacterium GWF2_49_21]HBC88492.1 hypothetical protein [Lentisphaeria bacterium]